MSHNQSVASDDRNASGTFEVREAFRELHDREIVGVADVDDGQAIMIIRRHVSIIPHDLKLPGIIKVIVVSEEVRNGHVAGVGNVDRSHAVLSVAGHEHPVPDNLKAPHSIKPAVLDGASNGEVPRVCDVENGQAVLRVGTHIGVVSNDPGFLLKELSLSYHYRDL